MAFIVIEGPDGSGKTSTVTGLSQELGYTAIKTPSQRYRAIRAEYDAPGVPVIGRFHFYLEGVRDSLAEIEELFKKGVPGVVVDRYTSSLGLCHSVMDPTTDYMELVNQSGLPEPDAQIILCPPLPTLIERIRERGGSRTDAHIETNPFYLAQLSKKYQSVSGNGIYRIDSSKSSLEEVIDQCVQIVSAQRMKGVC